METFADRGCNILILPYPFLTHLHTHLLLEWEGSTLGKHPVQYDHTRQPSTHIARVPKGDLEPPFCLNVESYYGKPTQMQKKKNEPRKVQTRWEAKVKKLTRAGLRGFARGIITVQCGSGHQRDFTWEKVREHLNIWPRMKQHSSRTCRMKHRNKEIKVEDASRDGLFHRPTPLQGSLIQKFGMFAFI